MVKCKDCAYYAKIFDSYSNRYEEWCRIGEKFVPYEHYCGLYSPSRECLKKSEEAKK